MAGEWRDIALQDVADELTVGYVGPMASEYVDDGIPFLRSLNVDPLRINKNDLKFITPEFHSRIRKSRLTPGDVVIVRTGKPGACSVVPEWLADANCSDLVIVRCGPQLDNRFLAYYVNTVACDHVAAHLVGAVQQHFNVGSARTLRLNLPPLPEHLEDSPLGHIPKGWKVSRLDEIASVLMGLSPNGESYNANGVGMPLINGPVEFGDYFPVKTKWTEAATRFAAEGDLIFCVRGSTTGRRVVSDGEYGIGRGVCAFRATGGYHSFVYQTVNAGLDRLLEKTTGSVFQVSARRTSKASPYSSRVREYWKRTST